MEFNLETITSDSEERLVNAIKSIFTKVNRIGCYFQYKMDIIRNSEYIKYIIYLIVKI